MRRLLLGLFIDVTACGADGGDVDGGGPTDTGASDGGDGTAGASSTTPVGTTDGDETSESTSDSGGTSSGTGTGEDASCPPREHSTCTVPVDCAEAVHACGTINSLFDENGCPRPLCGSPDFACPSGYVCHSPLAECGVCVGATVCSDRRTMPSDVHCSCIEDGDCGQNVCVPQDDLERLGC